MKTLTIETTYIRYGPVSVETETVGFDELVDNLSDEDYTALCEDAGGEDAVTAEKLAVWYSMYFTAAGSYNVNCWVNKINLKLLESQIDEFIENSGDDVSSVINHGSVLSFTHVSLVKQNFTYEVTLDDSGVITLTQQEPIRGDLPSESIFNQDTESISSKTLLKEIIVAKEKANNIEEVVAFISKFAKADQE